MSIHEMINTNNFIKEASGNNEMAIRFIRISDATSILLQLDPDQE